MGLRAAVGRGAANGGADVTAVQALLNLNGAEPALTIDGRIGPNTIKAIEAFQRHTLGGDPPTGVIEPGSATLVALRRGMPPGLLPAKLQGILPACTAARAQRYFPALMQTLERYDIASPARQAHFLAQVGHESGDFRYAEELASGDAYEGRADLGNTQPGDGARFKGRGLIQLTGRANYRAYGAAIGRDLTVDDAWTQVATDPGLCVDVAGWFWSRRKLNPLAERDDLRGITKRINGGYNGLADRQVKLERAKFFLGTAPVV